VHVARLPIGFAAEAQDGGVVDEAVGDRHERGTTAARSWARGARTPWNRSR
jgi:hypothetical protein